MLLGSHAIMQMPKVVSHSRETRPERGVTLVEVLIWTLIVIIASIGTLNYFAYGLGGVGKSGYRRAALERTRERLEQLMAANVTPMTPPQDGAAYSVTCSGGSCVWSSTSVSETVSVDDLSSQKLAATVQWVNDPSSGTTTLDTLALGVKVWFTKNTATDDDFNRVYVRTLRTPP